MATTRERATTGLSERQLRPGRAQARGAASVWEEKGHAVHPGRGKARQGEGAALSFHRKLASPSPIHAFSLVPEISGIALLRQLALGEKSPVSAVEA